MSTNPLNITPALQTYIDTYAYHENIGLAALRAETIDTFEAAPMQISPLQGQLLQLLIKLSNAKNILEIGTFTGYSAASMALALPDDGHVTCCDSSFDWTRLAIKHWEKMGLNKKITLHIAPALKTLAKLEEEQKKHNHFDLAFIDADKGNYPAYYEACLTLVRPGGIIAIDNVLWKGAVIDQSDQNENTLAIRKLNKKIHGDARVTMCMLPIADGLTLALKKDDHS